jgi:hypothetical protein
MRSKLLTLLSNPAFYRVCALTGIITVAGFNCTITSG